MSKPAAAIQSLLEQAVGLHQAGRTAEAAELYERIIAEAPDHFDATQLLGAIALQDGRLERAEALIAAALLINPQDGPTISNLGTVYLRKREFNLAREQFARAVNLQPDSTSALSNLGTALRELGRSREALGPLQRAHAAEPKSALICNLLGACFLDTGDVEAAATLFEAATVAEPGDADGWGNLAVALNRLGELERAKECADKAIVMRPDSAAAIAARAAIEFEQGDIESAIASYREAAALPNPSAQIICAFADSLWSSGRSEEALAQLRELVARDPDNAMALWKLAISQCRTYYDTAEEIDESRRALSESLAILEAWFRGTPRPEAYGAVGSTQPFFIAYQPFNNRELLSRYGRLCSEWMASMPMPGLTVRVASGTAGGGDKKMRIGIASAHIRDHSVWNAIVKGWIQHLDKTRFEIWLFRLGRKTDEETARAKAEVAHFEDKPKNLQEWVKAIRDAQLDALIYPEIGMDPLTTQLAALRLAPVQAGSWGHPETTGLPTLDFYFSADGLEPVDAQANYSEQLVRLPNLGVYVEPLQPFIAAPDFKRLKLPDDVPLLLCPGTQFKYSPLSDQVWARVAKGLSMGGGQSGWTRMANRLRGKKAGRLVFFRGGNAAMDALLAKRLRRAFDAEQVDFDAYVSIVPYLDRPRFFGLMQHAALMLDTVGFSGFNNAMQAIETGLPVLAREGNFMRGRLASAIMRRMDLPELVARTDEEFIESAVRLTLDPTRCQALRVEIAARRGILFNDLEPVRALERCLTDAIERMAALAR